MIKRVSVVVAASLLFMGAHAGEVVRLSEPVATTDTTETFGSLLDEAVPLVQLADVGASNVGETVRIEINACDNRVAILIVDHGCGIGDDVLRATITRTGGYDYAVSEFARVSGTLLPDRFFAHLGDECLHYRQRDVGLEQRDAHFAQGLPDAVLGQAALAAQLLHRPGQALGEIFKHGLLRKQVALR